MIVVWRALLALATVSSAVASETAAQAYPGKPLRRLFPSSPGSGSDTIGRIVATGLAQVVEQHSEIAKLAKALRNVTPE